MSPLAIHDAAVTLNRSGASSVKNDGRKRLSAELAADILLGVLFPGVLEDCCGRPGLHQVAGPAAVPWCPRRKRRCCRRRAWPAAGCGSRSRSCSCCLAAPASAPRSGAWRSGRAPSTARPSAAPPARWRWRARCTAAAAGRPRAPAPLVRSLSLTSSHSAALRSACSTFSARSPWKRLSRRPKATLSKMLIANGFGCWKTMPMWRRTATGSTRRRRCPGRGSGRGPRSGSRAPGRSCG